jgi:hypothetical protein
LATTDATLAVKLASFRQQQTDVARAMRVPN